MHANEIAYRSAIHNLRLQMIERGADFSFDEVLTRLEVIEKMPGSPDLPLAKESTYCQGYLLTDSGGKVTYYESSTEVEEELMEAFGLDGSLRDYSVGKVMRTKSLSFDVVVKLNDH